MLESLHKKHLAHACGPFGDVSRLLGISASILSSNCFRLQACSTSIFNDPFKHDHARAAHFKYNKRAANAINGLYGKILFILISGTPAYPEIDLAGSIDPQSFQ
jgi:hypothetical protein